MRSLATLAAMAIFAWVAAHWIWRALEPADTSPAATLPSDADLAERIAGGSAFGFSRGGGDAQAGAQALQAPDSRIRLLGIAREPVARNGAGRAIKGRHDDSQALFKIDKRILWLKAGDDLDPGVRLAAIDADGVRIALDGREVRMPLRADKPNATKGAAARAPAVATAPMAAPPRPPSTDGCRLQPEQRSRAYVLRPEIVDTVMRERAGWVDLFKPGPGGIVVQNPGGTGAMLGLYANDVLARADGAQLASADDVLRLVLQPLSRNDSVIVSGSRAGQPREWIYAGMNCINR